MGITREQARKIKQPKCGHSVLCVERGRCTACEREAAKTDEMPKVGPGIYADRATLVVNYNPASVNKAFRTIGATIAERRRVTDATTRAWLAAGRPKFRAPWRIVKLTVYAASKKRDPLNMAASWLKLGIDVLVNLGCLPGDGWSCIATPQGPTHWTHDKKNPRVEVIIEQVQNPF